MKHYIKLARPHHYIKNILVLLPLMCSGELWDLSRLVPGLLAFLAFSMMASAIYCLNDVKDREKDRQSTTKCHRPIASGAVSVKGGLGFGSVLFLLSLVFAFFAAGTRWNCYLAFGAYFLLNLGYSLGLKKVPLVDIFILAAGFVLRMLFGGAVTGIEPSSWLCLTVMAVSFYMGLGKRRNERRGQKGDTRAVLQYYSESFLDRNMYLCLALAVMFYAMWTVDGATVARVGSDALVWTVPIVLMICMKYSLTIDGESDGDPVEVLLRDKVLLLLVLALGVAVGGILYV